MKKLIFVDGNLLLSDKVQVIGHQANCQNVMGSGIARSIREMFPEAYSADTIAARRGSNVLGTFSKADLKMDPYGRNRVGNRISRIYNLYGQNLGTDYKKLYDRKTDYEGLYSALEKMVDDLMPTEADKMMFDYDRSPAVGFPYKMGSALGGGSWDIVQRLIEVAFDKYSADVFIYKFQP